jgi:hypothetical protein
LKSCRNKGYKPSNRADCLHLLLSNSKSKAALNDFYAYVF